MRGLGWMVLGLMLAGSAGAQTMVEYAAGAATGTAGGAAGKKVSDGIGAIFGKVDDQAKAAAAQGATNAAPATPASSPAPASSAPAAATTPKTAPARTAAARTAKVADPSTVPDPPAPASHAAVVNKTPEPPPAPVPELAPIAPPPPPPAPVVTAENLKGIAPGTSREEVMKLGAPASRMTMFGDEGHLLEIYTYMTMGTTFGVVRLTDGTVSKVELR